MRHSISRLALVVLAGLLAVALVAACGEDAEPEATESPTSIPAPTSTTCAYARSADCHA